MVSVDPGFQKQKTAQSLLDFILGGIQEDLVRSRKENTFLPF